MEKYLQSEGYPKLVQSLLEHKRTRGITREGHAYVYRGRKMGGLTRRMRSRFFPHYKGIEKHRTGRSGRQNGTRVHRQIYHMIECVRRKDGKCDCKIKTNPKRLNALTRQAMSKMKELGIEPVASEVNILCRKAGIGTSLDVIGVRWSKRSAIVSIKTGYICGHDRDLTGQSMLKPLDAISCSEQNQNCLQGMLESVILEKEYGMPFDDYIIIYLGHGEKGEASVEYLPRWCLDGEARTRVYERFCEKTESK